MAEGEGGEPDARQPYASIHTSLGCPYRCTFCCINAPFGVNRYRMRSPKTVVAEIDDLHRTYGVKTFKIIDDRNQMGFTATMIPGELSTFAWR